MIRYGSLGWNQKMPFIASAQDSVHVVNNLFQTNNEKNILLRVRYFIGLLGMGCFILGNGNLRFNSQELLCWLPLNFYDITLIFMVLGKSGLKSYIFPRSISSYSVPVIIIIIHNNNKVQMYMHIYWNRLLAFFFFCSEEWLRPLLRQDKQVLVHWWYYPDRCVFNC